MTASHLDKGKRAELEAAHWLKKRKLKILQCNFTCRHGEIDIIALEKKTLCFIEVRYRAKETFGSAAETVTAQKQRRIIKTAETYLQQNSKYQNFATRLDIIAITGSMDDPTIDWIKNAFMISA